MPTPTDDVSRRPPGDASAELLTDLAAALHASASAADIAEERLRDVASTLGLDAQFFLLQSFFAADLRRGGSERVALRRIPFDTHWDLTESAALVDLCRSIIEGRVDVPGARAELSRIVNKKSRYPAALAALAWGVYGGAVAVRVGGRWVEMLAGAAIGLVAGWIHRVAGRHKQVGLEKTFLGAFLGTLVAFVLTLVLPPFDYPRALFGGISLLIPAMVVTIGIHELANEELESGAVRLAYGLICFGLLGAGVVAAFSIGKIFGLHPSNVQATKLPDLVVLAVVALGGVALVVALEGRRRDAGWIVLATVLAFGAQELSRLVMGDRGAPIVVAFVLGCVAYLYASRPGRLPFTMLIPGLLQLAPGFLGTNATFRALTMGHGASTATFFDVILLAFQLGAGIMVASLLFNKRRRRKARALPAPAH